MPSLEITAITPIAVSIPLVKPISNALGTVTHAHTVLVKVEDGVNVGWGGAANIPFVYGVDQRTIFYNLRDYIIPALMAPPDGGAPQLFPNEIARIHHIMGLALAENFTAKCAVDIAMYDLWGKQAGLPVYKLLSEMGHYSTIPAFDVISATEDPANIPGLVNDMIARNIPTIKVKIGTNWKQDARGINQILEILRESTHQGPQMPADTLVRCDANTNYKRSEALRFLAAIDDPTQQLEYFEQGLSRFDLFGMKQLSDASLIPICADESIQTIEDVHQVAAQNAASAIVLKPMKNGGLYPTMRIAEFAQSVGIPCSLSGSASELAPGFAAAMHLYQGCRNIVGGVEFFTHATIDNVLSDADWAAFYPITDGQHPVPDKSTPGLGITVDETKVEIYKRDYSEILPPPVSPPIR